MSEFKTESGRDTTNLAKRLFEAQCMVGNAEWDLGDVLNELAPDAWEDFSYDDYDQSIEVYCNPGHDLAPFARLYECGFRIVWAHPHTGGRGNPLCKCPVLTKPLEQS